MPFFFGTFIPSDRRNDVAGGKRGKTKRRAANKRARKARRS